MVTTDQFKNGRTIKIGGDIYLILEFQHVKPGKGGAFVRTKLKNLRQGSVIDKTFRAGERVEEAFIEDRRLQYLYQSNNLYHFMDEETFDEKIISKDELGDTINFLKADMRITASIHEGRIIKISPPIFAELKVQHTEPGLRGDTVKAGSKPARLETGLTIQVPLFINVGDTIRIDTRTGEYVGRV